MTTTRYTHAFFDALGAWQRGWGEDVSRQRPIREALLREAANIGPEFKVPLPVLFRKRHLYKVDMPPLIAQRAIDDGACSWTSSRAFADRFKDEWLDGAITGAIIRHQPWAQDIVLNIPLLWDDPDLVRHLDGYEEADGEHAAPIRHLRGDRDQFEVIATSPLSVTDIIRFSGKVGELEPLIQQAGLSNEDDEDRAFRQLGAAGIYEGSVMKVEDDAAQRVVARVLHRFAERLQQSG